MRKAQVGWVAAGLVLCGAVGRAGDAPNPASTVEQQPPAKQEPPEDETFSELLSLLKTPVTSASLQSQTAMLAPAVIDVITREQIQTYGWTDLGQVLGHLPGFAPSMDFNHRTVSSRGLFESFANNHLLHLVDGIPMNDPFYGTAWTWTFTPNLFMAKSVEVLRGPGSALYGSNATSGVVHVKTVSPRDLPSGGEGALWLGERGDLRIEALAGREGSLFDATLGLSSMRSDGNSYASVDGSLRRNPDGSLAKFQTWDKHSGQYLWAKLEGRSALEGLTVQYHYLHFNWEFGQGNIMLTNNNRENLDESRQMLTFEYAGDFGSKVKHSSLLRYQKRPYAWFTQLFPNGLRAGGVDYPNGIWENVDTEVTDWFGRTKVSYAMAADSNLLLGLELDRFLYEGDRGHFSNVDLRPSPTPGYPLPFPNNEFRDVGPVLEWILDHPVTNLAGYVQFTSGRLLGRRVQLTLGLRADRTSFEYTDIESPTRATASKSYEATSPRAALVFLPTEDLSVKLMAGKAFRAPAPIEFGVAHNYYTLSNIKQLEPEVITTSELAFDWKASSHLNWRTNFFRTTFDKVIGYDSLSVYRNLYTLSTQGLETELLFGFSRFTGFANYAYAKRFDEEILDPGIALSKDKTTWYPTHSANLGVSYRSGRWILALSGHYQGKVDRRASEVGLQKIPYFTNPDDPAINLDEYRARTLSGWTSLDLRLSYQLHRNLQVAVWATNAMDTDDNYLVKTFAFPFDFKADPRRISGSMRLNW